MICALTLPFGTMVCSVCEFFFPSLVGEHYLMHMEGYVEQGMRKQSTILDIIFTGLFSSVGISFCQLYFPY